MMNSDSVNNIQTISTATSMAESAITSATDSGGVNYKDVSSTMALTRRIAQLEAPLLEKGC